MERLLDVRLLTLVCVLGVVVGDFGSIASSGRQLAFRDFSDFYYPLYQKVQHEWAAGRLPLWSNTENGGMPLLGNPTAAVLYPGKVIYACLPYPWAAKVYVVAHVILAFVAMVVLLRGWGVSAVGSTLGGLAYAFGAPVLTQYSNVVFLVGAAWMPLGLRSADAWLRSRDGRGCLGLAFVLAMQLLGGDPEAAYLTAFASVAGAVGFWIVADRPGRGWRISLVAVGLLAAYGGLLTLEILQFSTGLASVLLWVVLGGFVLIRGGSIRDRGSLARRWLGLAGACGLALALSGAQLVPTLEFIGQSSRGDSSIPIDIYAHGIHPARLVEWFWPHFFGSTFGVNRNWLTALPPTNDQNVWMTSIYLGGLTLLLAAGAIGKGGGSTGRGWMIGLAVVGILGGLGDHASPIFIARALPGGETRFGTLEGTEPSLPREDGRLRDGDGGVYWFLSSALPGFRSFRYPGKLFIPGALGIAALAGMGFDGLVAGRRRAGVGLAWGVLSVGLIGLVMTFVANGWVLGLLEGRAAWANSAFGPFDPLGALTVLRGGLIQGSLNAAGFLILARLAATRPKLAGIGALLILSADLVVANRGEVGTIAASAYEFEPRALAAIERSERENPEAGPFRIFRLPSWALMRWSEISSPDRLEEIVRWERDTLRPKYEQTLGLESTFAYSTAELAASRAFFEPFRVLPAPEVARRLGIPADRPVVYYPRRGFDLWNTRYFIVPARLAWNSSSRGFASLAPNTVSIFPEGLTGPDARSRREEWGRTDDFQVLRNRAALPRAWVVHRVIPVGANEVVSPADRRQLMTRILYQDDELWHDDALVATDPRRVAHVEASITELAGLAGGIEASEPVKVSDDHDPSRVELRVTLGSPGLVILADMIYPGWTLEIDGRPAPIFRANRAMRGAVVPAGEHRLVYQYRPASLTIGIGLSVAGWLVWVVVLRSSGRSGGLDRTSARLGP